MTRTGLSFMMLVFLFCMIPTTACSPRTGEKTSLLRVLRSLFQTAGKSEVTTAQDTGILQGVVQDATTSVVPGAEVKLRYKATGKKVATAETNKSGQFEFIGMPTGRYILKVEAKGFEDAAVPVSVHATPGRPIQVRLEFEEEVTVTSAEQNFHAVQIPRRWLDDLPVKDGDPAAILSLFVEPATLGVGGPKIIVDGVESDTLDLPPSDIKAAHVNKSPYSAEFGGPGKGRLEVATRSVAGTQQAGKMQARCGSDTCDDRSFTQVARNGVDPIHGATPGSDSWASPPLQPDFDSWRLSEGWLRRRQDVLSALAPGADLRLAAFGRPVPGPTAEESRTSRGRQEELLQEGKGDEMVSPQSKLPLTHLQAENLKSSRQVEVRTNDRRPLREVSLPQERFGSFFAVQVGAFRNRTNAERLRANLAREHGTAFLRICDSPRGLFYRVLVGHANDIGGAAALAAALRTPDQKPFVVAVEELPGGDLQ